MKLGTRYFCFTSIDNRPAVFIHDLRRETAGKCYRATTTARNRRLQNLSAYLFDNYPVSVFLGSFGPYVTVVTHPPERKGK